ncbi:hypothetical protein JXL21_12500 [Candidatus Bathyarchaeota archaeon]|nr:hypothetical protein [Candidatus Bathyarchaeota archaeon]
MKQSEKTLQEWGHAYTAMNLDHLKSLYAQGSVFEMKGTLATTAKESALKLAEFDHATGTQRTLKATQITGDKVRAEMTESSEWLKAAGIKEAHYDSVFVIKEGQIQSLSIVPKPETRKATEHALTGLIAWAAKERPELLAQAMPGGRIRYDADAGRQMTALMQEWKRATR